MNELKDAKLYGGIGSILSSFGGFVPLIGSLLSIAGFILEVLAVNKISRAVNDRDIFRNYIVALVVGIIGVVVAMIFGAVILLLLGGFEEGMYIFSREGYSLPFIGAMVLVLVVIWITLVIAMSFMKK
ncbi:MAG: DUF996 domain-containing protein, partial [Thermoproteota archaeon]